MTHTFPPANPSPQTLGDDAVALVRRWLHLDDPAYVPAATPSRGSKSAQLLAEVLKDQDGLDFTIGFVDRVIRPEDPAVAARNLAQLARKTPSFLPWYMKGAVRLGGVMAPALPGVVVPVAQRVLREMVGHLIVDARPARLGKAIASLRGEGIRLNINLLGEAVLGHKEADARLAGTRELLARDDVDYVSIKVSSVVSTLNLWDFEGTVDRVTERLIPLYRLAASSPAPKFINLDMEEYHDLDLTVAVFKRILDTPELKNLESGIVLQAYLPDALATLQDLTEWAQARRAAGGSAIKVRLVKGANLAMELVDAAIHHWEPATLPSKQATDTNYKRCLDWALRPENADAVRIGVAGHNLFDIALARSLSVARGVQDRIEFEMLLGMAEDQAAEVRKDVGSLLLYTPVVRPEQFDVAISYLIRRLEENASQENFMSAVFELTRNEELFEREKNRFLASLKELDGGVPAPNRVQTPDRFTKAVAGEFDNQSDSDPSLPAIREWAKDVLSRVPGSTLGVALVESSRLETNDDVDTAIARARAAQQGWGSLTGAERAKVLRKAAGMLAAKRGDLVEVSASETGKTIAESDPEISEAIDFANYYALLAEELDTVEGARFVPSKLTVATPPWNFPVAIAAGSALAPLAAGSAVVLKPAPQAKRSGAVLVEALWEAGVPKDVLIFADVTEGPVGQHLISHPDVDRVILTGAYDTAKLFRSWRTDLPLLAETSGKNSLIVTPSSDLDLAAADVVRSAFGHAGQKCSAASLAILVGSAASSARFRNQLVDAAASLKVGYPQDPETEMGPIVEPAEGKLKDALTTLGEGESWLVEPRQLDDSGRLWSPGVRVGVKPGSYFHLTEFFGPVLGVMHADTLEQAIEWQNASAYGLTGGIHTLNPDEVTQWLESVEAGNLYVNRGITGAIVRRQPFGGWKRSSVGPGAKAGGPNYLIHLGSWEREDLHPGNVHAPLCGPVRQLLHAAEVPDSDKGFLARAAADDQRHWVRTFATHEDVSGLGVERNEFRYLPVPVTVRLNEAGNSSDFVRVVGAGLRAGSTMQVSTPEPLSPALAAVLSAHSVAHRVEDDAAWLAAAAGAKLARVRLVGGGYTELCGATDGNPDVAIYAGPVTEAGRLELLPFLHEQAITITAHRFGNPDNVSGEVLR
ncbi:RHH-type proline utilization regulon transcriptional repressor/proline dehydrogenase/delta 1-pyrroline-5-carboxylate dehydrogenase [Arthrobacter pigmenti]|uniref:L-glutamate gamma-semialdehyde dehydrogenase n=1 Tax=Arthrobacter pigmenti TaxID=271432 RepID=A0A846RW06_9MICC|nr:bifunctional proline dehydrogenase/L-glutamate gamma-semialdehyde dehydrogenase [Arthrobacter pigmenti]NJC22431.1 RHH-type proline utilization regulon transcriptional repressor/proline dehydrogenase/delta 1-pyrroline-5-carboxylate dehydrogenase [Arthrobacter pigmenti]